MHTSSPARDLAPARVDLPGRPGLAARCKRRIKALQVALEIGKRAIAFSVRRARQEHVRLLTPGDHVGRLHDQAIELRAQRATVSAPNASTRLTPMAYNTLMVPWSIASHGRQLRCRSRREPHILRPTCVRVLISPD